MQFRQPEPPPGSADLQPKTAGALGVIVPVAVGSGRYLGFKFQL